MPPGRHPLEAAGQGLGLCTQGPQTARPGGQAVERPALGGKGGGADSHEVSMDALLRRPLSAEAPADPTLSGPPASLEGYSISM